MLPTELTVLILNYTPAPIREIIYHSNKYYSSHRHFIIRKVYSFIYFDFYYKYLINQISLIKRSRIKSINGKIQEMFYYLDCEITPNIKTLIYNDFRGTLPPLLNVEKLILYERLTFFVKDIEIILPETIKYLKYSGPYCKEIVNILPISLETLIMNNRSDKFSFTIKLPVLKKLLFNNININEIPNTIQIIKLPEYNHNTIKITELHPFITKPSITKIFVKYDEVLKMKFQYLPCLETIVIESNLGDDDRIADEIKSHIKSIKNVIYDGRNHINYLIDHSKNYLITRIGMSNNKIIMLECKIINSGFYEFDDVETLIISSVRIGMTIKLPNRISNLILDSYYPIIFINIPKLLNKLVCDNFVPDIQALYTIM